MTPLPQLDCNRCGECCRVGGDCTLRVLAHSGRDLPERFEGVCELLTASNECGAMARLTPAFLRDSFGVRGVCEFPSLRRPSAGSSSSGNNSTP